MPPKVHLVRHAQGEHNVTVSSIDRVIGALIDLDLAQLRNPRCGLDSQGQGAMSRAQRKVSIS
jgi:hypothetical protein